MYLLFRVLSNTVLVNRYDIMNVYDSLHRCINNIIPGYSRPCTNGHDRYSFFISNS